MVKQWVNPELLHLQIAAFQSDLSALGPAKNLMKAITHD